LIGGFCAVIDKAFTVTDPSNGGTPPFDRVMLLKVVVLQRMYNLADDITYCQIVDQRGFRRILGISSHVQVPDAKTIWHYRMRLKKHDIIHEIFSLFTDKRQNPALMFKNGAIIDILILQVPW